MLRSDAQPDLSFAASDLYHGMALVTRNAAGVVRSGARLLELWTTVAAS